MAIARAPSAKSHVSVDLGRHQVGHQRERRGDGVQHVQSDLEAQQAALAGAPQQQPADRGGRGEHRGDDEAGAGRPAVADDAPVAVDGDHGAQRAPAGVRRDRGQRGERDL
jgi:hypothetical protein